MNIDFNKKSIIKPKGKRTPEAIIIFSDLIQYFEIFTTEIDYKSAETSLAQWQASNFSEDYTIKLLKDVIVTFGEGHRIWGRFFSHYESNIRHTNEVLKQVYQQREDNYSILRTTLKQIKGLGGVSYGTKMLRFINPSFVVLDSIIMEEFQLTPKDYSTFQINCQAIAKDISLRPVDVESALFTYVQIANPLQKKKRWRRYQK